MRLGQVPLDSLYQLQLIARIGAAAAALIFQTADTLLNQPANGSMHMVQHTVDVVDALPVSEIQASAESPAPQDALVSDLVEAL
ncbi:uncharacterized protein PGTG_22101 [Puccinia graminis f. sp. tritici CRL 75-36-700-3]|uniref:Uncharacterized protein n=1 Tax=Puccinia graminis f. sp. tritici (strain CRL 75-36-700-3 / race SCCL) TaxID=418459 RepID=H6QTA1_PUCGT|nr:uncharacterized protein PGTG_22101 [Puccinia graminis f. sp. tritici CRL 75-36-700-3]EHS64046.1 hypothetical protein PGTG_22101 [Puccinia graminis f. sp. tritici CRL 75-36-700-3]